MNTQQRHLISDLMRKYSSTGTESLIAYVAETNGMLEACKALLQSVAADKLISGELFQLECADTDVASQAFLQEVKNIVALFLPNEDVEDHHATLGLSARAGQDEIKRAYRALSRKYHPDTASPEIHDTSEKFIAINKAYQALMHEGNSGKQAQPKKEWRRKRARKSSPEQKRQIFLWLFGLLIIFVVVSSIASMNLKKRAMLAGLQESRGAFLPPITRKTDTLTSTETDKKTPLPQSYSVTPGEPSDKAVERSAQQPKVDLLQGQYAEDVEVPTKEVVVTASIVEKEQEKAAASTKSSVEPAKEEERILAAAAVSAQPNTETFADVSDPIKDTSLPDATLATPAVEVMDDKASTEQDQNRMVKAKEVGGKAIKTKPRQEVAVAAEPAEKSSRPIAAVEQLPHKLQPEVAQVPITRSTTPPSQTTGVQEKKEVAEATVKPAEAGVSAVLPVEPQGGEKKGEGTTTLEEKVDLFLEEYISAYEQRNLILFSRFFVGDAEENGQPFTSVMPVYLDLFASAVRVSFQVDNRNSTVLDGQVVVDGKFKVSIEYANGGKVAGNGPIHFLLTESDKRFLIKKMQYEFYAE